MRTTSLAFLMSLLISGCGLDGPQPQQAKEAAKPTVSAPIKPSAAPAEKKSVREQIAVTSPANETTIPPSVPQPTPARASAARKESVSTVVAEGQPGPRLIFNESENTAAGIGWNKDIVLARPTTVGFHITSQGRFAVTIMTDKAYQALQQGDEKGLAKSDVVFMKDSQGNEMSAKVSLPAGTWWFNIENRTETAVDFNLKCYELNK